ncbi:hypothetical protein GE107_22120 [Cohnella sp. CFH 77786]|uniref:hypothetical protein n=1 Tax=Cohnella sp. CFH 77786 TaxID=2662265 RepID=UPI001C60B794|nr:hypothetical protein [Cohnella sp. CFH 77786]MBW5448741.1 hypothetical protein [Cohnella sp. CFH 77786]
MIALPKGYLKFAGWTLLIGGAMGVTGQLLHIGDTPATLEEIPGFLSTAVNTHVLLAWASILILMGMPGIYMRQGEGLKKWGWIGFPLLFMGMILEIFHGPFQILGYPIIYDHVKDAETLKVVNNQINNLMVDQYPLTLVVLIPIIPGILLGLLLLGIATIKARIFPKWLGILTLVVLVILIGGIAVPTINVFPAIHVVFALFGGILAFGKGEAATFEARAAA